MKKTEKQKMLAGELYLADDPELVEDSKRASRLLGTYNSTTIEQQEQRQEILRELFGKIGKKATIVPPFHCDYGDNIYAGNKLYINYGCVILDCNIVHIGDNVLCGPCVQIYTAYHPTEPEIRLTGQELASPIKIGDNVWIGGNVVICPGVTIGNNTTIGAGSVVTKDIPENAIAAGNPCRIIRHLS
ncbi:sugar O-acetyltransferase [Calothrix sp. PCC 7507]|uniref:sugar O-acetyltransferase n=1 Tax=Calothrix sp. PCC 7507 TaxID=99598 RepID=UPI000301A0DE|nr:sugar O-acetyltransferase [Calothrix sp. PCC 7507]